MDRISITEFIEEFTCYLMASLVGDYHVMNSNKGETTNSLGT